MSLSPLLLGGCALFDKYSFCKTCLTPKNEVPPPNSSQPESNAMEDLGDTTESVQNPILLTEEQIRKENVKSIYFSQDFPDDIYFRDEKLQMAQHIVKKFRAVQSRLGFGHFNLIGMDEFFLIADRNPQIGSITSKEKLFLEELFYFDAKKYGFMGDKVFKTFTHTLNKRDVLKIPHSGHYLLKSTSLDIYERVKKDIGSSLVLTSGVRGSAKQFHLFLEKGLQVGGNMSKASRSLAPPGYSFHGRGDFDVGKVGYGLKNFSQDFAKTDEFKRLLNLGYVDIRYRENNLLGVRFEPWHIKVET